MEASSAVLLDILRACSYDEFLPGQGVRRTWNLWRGSPFAWSLWRAGGVESAVLLKELLAEGHTVIPCYVKADLPDPTQYAAPPD